MNIPFEYLFGVDIAMKKLRPGAAFELSGTQFTKWEDPNNLPPPSWEEVVAQIESDKLKYEEYIKNLESQEETPK